MTGSATVGTTGTEMDEHVAACELSEYNSSYGTGNEPLLWVSVGINRVACGSAVMERPERTARGYRRP